MVNQTLARRYAIAVATLAREQSSVESVSADLATLAQTFGAPGLLRDFFESPVVDRPSKERALAEVFEGKIHPIALHTLLLLVRKRREGLLGAIVTEYLVLERAARGAQTMTLQSARTLDTKERSQLIARLEALYGKKFEVTEVVDSDLIGGVRIVMGDRRIDGSVAGRLNELAHELAQST